MTLELKAKPLIGKIYAELDHEIREKGLDLTLAVIMMGTDPAAQYYVQNIEKKGSRIGVKIKTIKLPEEQDQKGLLAILNDLNDNPKITGIMVQKPLPGGIDEEIVNENIDPHKDVDGFHPLNMGNLVLEKDSLLPSTPVAVLEILKFYQIRTSGKHIMILGRSNIVGKPLLNLLLRKDETGNGTVTVCHSRTENLAGITGSADILIAALGRPLFVTADMIREGSILIDVGINEIKDEQGSRYVGDIDFHSCYGKASAISPVPGGVGSVTTAMLLRNVLEAFKKQRSTG